MPTLRGLSFPFRRSREGFPAPATDDDLLWESIVQLILTGAGERVLRPDVGSLVLRLLFENDDAVLGDLVAADVSQLLARYEPRVLLQSVTTTDINRDKGSITLDITWINRATGTSRTDSVTLPGTGGS